MISAQGRPAARAFATISSSAASLSTDTQIFANRGPSVGPSHCFIASVSSQRISLPLEIVIEDNGPGIQPDLLPILFDPFVTTKANGSGLGLALVAKIVGDHGGVIDSDSRPGRTRFRVLLPVAKGLKMPEEAAEVAAQ